MQTSSKTITWISIFGVAMAYLETSVVVYLRALYYPQGFDFPLAPIEPTIAVTEIFREAATLIMLAGAGIMAGRTKHEKFAYFIYTFAVWDIFYYVFLKILLNWPASFLTWDVLFLIPITWTGPIIAPIINSLTMILLGIGIIKATDRNLKTRLTFKELSLLIAASIFTIIVYVWDYSRFILSHYTVGELFSLPSKDALFDLSFKYIPYNFEWTAFIVAEIALLVPVIMFFKRNRLFNKMAD